MERLRAEEHRAPANRNRQLRRYADGVEGFIEVASGNARHHHAETVSAVRDHRCVIEKSERVRESLRDSVGRKRNDVHVPVAAVEAQQPQHARHRVLEPRSVRAADDRRPEGAERRCIEYAAERNPGRAVVSCGSEPRRVAAKKALLESHNGIAVRQQGEVEPEVEVCSTDHRAGRAERQKSKPPQARTLSQEIGRLGRDTALAYYLLTDDHLRIVIATERGQVSTEIPIDARALRGQIGDFLDRIGGREDIGAAARALYETIAKPVDQAAERAGATRLVLELDGALRYVPFAALSDGRKTLIEKYAIELRAPAGRTPPTATRPAPSLSVRGLGVTRAVPGFRSLPAVADELRSVVHGPIAGLASDAPGEGVTKQGHKTDKTENRVKTETGSKTGSGFG